MGCFFGCFRDRDDRHHHHLHHHHRSRAHLVSDASRSKPTEAAAAQNRLSSLFSSEDKEDSSLKDNEAVSLGSPTIDKELNNEAKFLKACGTLVETPVEIRKASRLNGSPLHDGNSEQSKFHSWLPNTSIQKLQLENQPDPDQPPTPIKISEDWCKGSDISDHTPSSCLSNVQSNGSVSNSCEGSGMSGVHTAARMHAHETEKIATSNSPWIPATDPTRIKSVRFECHLSPSKDSSSENDSQNIGKCKSSGNHSISKPLPYPTPLKLSDEMQTPGTVFPANMENFPNGKSRVRSQYVHSTMNPVQSASEWNALKEDESNFHQLSGELRESFKEDENATKSKEGGKETLSGNELNVECSLSSWLKPVTSNQDGNNLNFRSFPSRPHAGRTPADRPIIGTVAAHWNEDETSRISPKWWDGNGIPNSTNKYKEDQKVSWHATPFEERLEKALSEETVVTDRKNIFGNPIAFDENEESDTAFSQLQSSSHAKSVVSF